MNSVVRISDRIRESMGRWGLSILVCIFATHAACAEDAGLKALSAKLVALRGTHDPASQYDAGPGLTPIKHLLRRWVEAELPSLEKEDDPGKVAQRLNATLKAAGLTCEWDDKRCQEQMERADPGVTEFDGRGYLSDVSLSYLEYRHYLTLKTRVGVRCGFDESAYIYEWRSKTWHLLLETEQDRYDDKHYSAQNFIAIRSSPSGAAWNGSPTKPPLILTLGFSPWCQSNWQMLYTRLWRASPTNTSPAPLADSADSLFLGDDTMAEAQISKDDLLVEFEGETASGDARRHVVHYRVHDDFVERIAPVAFNAGAFVDEWLTRPWPESAMWTEPGSRARDIQDWYRSFHAGPDRIFGEFDDEKPTRCRSDATLWQVGFTKQAGPKNPEVTAHFLVRWMAPYRFTMVKIQKAKFPDCDIKDAMPDNLGTLFPFPSSQ